MIIRKLIALYENSNMEDSLATYEKPTAGFQKQNPQK